MQVGFLLQVGRAALGAFLANVKPGRTTRTALVKAVEKAALKIAHVAELGGFLLHQLTLKRQVVADKTALRRII